MIKITNLQKYFNKNKQNEIHVINDISLTFPETGLVVLLGASGSGKTTLLNVIGGLDKVQSGTIELNSSIMKKYNANLWDEIRTQQIGYVFQNYNLLKDMSVFDNIAFVLKMIGLQDKEEIERRVHYVLKAVNMFKYRKRMASQLSGGQQQRVAIARALVKNPSIVIADEPTGNLDSQNTLEVMNILKVISKQKLVVLVTHENNIAEFYGDRIIEIKDGAVVKDKIVKHDGKHSFESDNIIYLKDLKNLVSEQNKNVRMDVYADDSTTLQKLDVKLILKNNTIYLDVNSNINKVKLLQDNVGVAVIDDHFKKKTKEEITNTEFNLTELEMKEGLKKKQKTSMSLSLKNLFQLVVKKLSGATKKSKLMFFAFFLSGMLMAFASSYLFAAFQVNPYDFMIYQDNYITLGEYGGQVDTENVPAYDTLMNIVTNVDEDANLHLYYEGMSLPIWQTAGYTDATLYVTRGYYNPYSFSSVLDDVSTLSDSHLVQGHLPENDYQFVVDITSAKQLLENYGNDYGIWSLDSMLHEKVHVALLLESQAYAELELVGYVDTGVDVSYLTSNMLQLLSPNPFNSLNISFAYNSVNMDGSLDVENFLPLELVNQENNLMNFSLLDGDFPQQNTNEVLISNYRLERLIGSGNTASFPLTVQYETVNGTQDLVISGVYNTDEYLDMIIAPNSNLIKLRYHLLETENDVYQLMSYIRILSNNPQALMSALSAQDISSFWELQQSQDLAHSYIIINVLSVLGAVVVLLLLNGLGFYFISRSNMMNRIYEVSVYRALGVKKKDISKLFLLEILSLIAITSLIGYVLGTVLAGQVQVLFERFQMENAFFTVNLFSILSGFAVMIAMDVVFGLLPVWSLLKKTPSEIMSKYDI